MLSSKNDRARSSRTMALATAAAVTATASLAQAQFIFQETAGTARNDRAYDIIRVSTGGYLSVGVRNDIETGNDILVTRYADNGNLMWSRIIGGGGNDIGYSVRELAGGSFIIAAETNSVAADLGIALVLLNNAGNLIGARVYTGTPHVGNGVGVAVRETSTGYAVVGRVNFGASQYGVLISTDPAGIPFFQNRYENTFQGDNTFGSFADLRVMPDDGFTVCGFDAPGPAGDRDAILVRIGPAGVPFLAARYGAPDSNQSAVGLEDLDNAGFGFVSGDTSIAAPGGTRYVQTGPGLGLLSSFTYSGWFAGHASVRKDRHDRLILAGNVVQPGGTTVGSMLLMRPDGTVNRAMQYGAFGNQSEVGEAAAPTDDCGYIMAGWTESFGANPIDKYIVKTTNFLRSDCNEQPFSTGKDSDTPDILFAMNEVPFGRHLDWNPFVFQGTNTQVLCRDVWCRSDFDGNGFVNGDDFDAYVVEFEAGNISADYNCDTFVTGDDFDAFVAAFEAGC